MKTIYHKYQCKCCRDTEWLSSEQLYEFNIERIFDLTRNELEEVAQDVDYHFEADEDTLDCAPQIAELLSERGEYLGDWVGARCCQHSYSSFHYIIEESDTLYTCDVCRDSFGEKEYKYRKDDEELCSSCLEDREDEEWHDDTADDMYYHATH